MAARFWVGGAGTWDNASTTHWSASTGGASGASAPTSADDVTFDSSSGLSTGVTVTIAGTAAANNVTVNGPVGKNQVFSLSGSPTFSGAVAFIGNSDANPILVQSNGAGTTRTLTINGSHGAHANVHFMDITIAGTAGTLTGALIGDCGGNSGITFNVSATQTFVGGTANWSAAASWTSRVPLPQDDVVVNTTTAGTLTADMARLGRSINFTSFTKTLNLNSISHTVFGSLTLVAGMTITFPGNPTWTFRGRGSYTVTWAGFAPTGPNFNAPGGTYTSQDGYTSATQTFTIAANTTFDGNGNAFTVGNVTGAGNIILGGGTWSLGGTGSLTVWSLTGTVTPGGSIVQITATDSAVTKTFAGNGATFSTLKHIATGSAALTITGANTFATLDLECTTARTVTLSAAQIVTGSLTLKGASGQTLSLVSNSVGTARDIALSYTATLATAFMSLSADVTIRISVTPAGGVTLGGTATCSATGAAALAASATLVVSGFRTRFGVAGLTSSATVTVTGFRTRLGVAALTASSSFTIVGFRTRLGVAALTSTATLAVSGVRGRSGTVGLTAITTITVSASSAQLGAAALLAYSTITAGRAPGPTVLTLTPIVLAFTYPSATVYPSSTLLPHSALTLGVSTSRALVLERLT